MSSSKILTFIIQNRICGNISVGLPFLKMNISCKDTFTFSKDDHFMQKYFVLFYILSFKMSISKIQTFIDMKKACGNVQCVFPFSEAKLFMQRHKKFWTNSKARK